MRTLLRIAVAAATLLVLGMAVAPGAAYAMDGDERVARMRLRVVDAVNEGHQAQIQRAHDCPGSRSADEVGRLEARLREGCRLAADLRDVRAVHRRGRLVHAVGGGPVATPTLGGSVPAPTPGGPVATPPSGGPVGSPAPGGPVDGARALVVGPDVSGGGDADTQDTVFQAGRAELPRLPIGVLSLVGGVALALVGGGMAMVAVGWLPRRWSYGRAAAHEEEGATLRRTTAG
ncbi:hypothetical protein N4G70_21260 [Streptomyces sp. ASQP_92]|uniref:hypothetical protein n=1 Tax=Streptomyces sp. ASQP_92 TaxID=2979116 RepID=UPI0021BE0523|nr:hypothetical protein [Streptomyces sp. ASQP_92]MCT9091374.1 hypothetical protein [Streptomyces sp. ASQP_92]